MKTLRSFLEQYEKDVKEKAYRLAGDTRTQVGGQLAQLFKKHMEREKLPSESDVQKKWKAWYSRDGVNHIKAYVEKAVKAAHKNTEGLVYIGSNGLNITWEEERIGSVYNVKMSSEFLIYVQFADDVDSVKAMRKMKGFGRNSIINPNKLDNILGRSDKGIQTLELRESPFLLQFDDK